MYGKDVDMGIYDTLQKYDFVENEIALEKENSQESVTNELYKFIYQYEYFVITISLLLLSFSIGFLLGKIQRYPSLVFFAGAIFILGMTIFGRFIVEKNVDKSKFKITKVNTPYVLPQEELDYPAAWPFELWQICWSEQKWVNFTLADWINLSTEKQIEYAKAYQQWYAKKQGLPVKKEFIISGVSFSMVFIPPGSFWMGSPENEQWRNDKYESPKHKVAISKPFWLGETQVTQSQWKAIIGNNPSSFKSDELPVEQVTWFNCQEFCRKTKLKFPSEAQWEYACRAGTTARFFWGEKWDKEKINSASYWCNQDLVTKEDYDSFGFLQNWHQLGAKTVDAKNFEANAFGLYGILGNVWEWCEDTWHENYIGAPEDGTSWIDEAISSRVGRGGTFSEITQNVRSASRGRCSAKECCNNIGFRVLKLVTP